jgi:hypothetical protein
MATQYDPKRVKDAKHIRDLITLREKKGVNPISIRNLKHTTEASEIDFLITKLLRKK